MKLRTHTISKVAPGSIAEELGIEAGDKLLAINGKPIIDVLDYIEWSELNELELTIQKPDGQEWIFDIEKDDDEDLGMDFEVPLMDQKRACANNCIFCFIDQLPFSSRCSLQFKDDDWRLSFLMGNYITLTNLSQRDMKRIKDKGISPLYISIHTTNPELRQMMMGNKKADRILDILKEFRDANISIHCQIVLCRDINDGEELDRSLGDLWEFHDIIQSIAIVPVGLTGHREKLEPILTPYDEKSSIQVVDQVEKWQKEFKSRGNTRLVFLADEFYVMANRAMPPFEDYEDFPQIENGIGLVQKFRNQFNRALDGLEDRVMNRNELSIVTGESASKVIEDMANLARKRTGKTIYVYPIKNNFFGGQVTVAGLVTGGDIVEGLKGKPLGKKVLIPSAMLRQDNIFLDDMTLDDLRENLGVKIVAVPVDGEAFLEQIISD
ncbi:MAG TPA: DUF512 domain-containing protein [Clostridia bacterium]|nr:DUF512 domain-containing protein [Clostridia bacterium]